MKKRRKDAFLLLLALFTDEKRGKSHLRGLSSLLNISPCRLAATSANKVPQPSSYSITMATGSKRLSADSDSLLCHVRLWRTSRVEFGCGRGCEHREMRNFSNTFLLTPHPSRFACTFSHRRRLINHISLNRVFYFALHMQCILLLLLRK